MDSTVLGLLFVVIAGFAAGTFAIPFKFAKGWQWENNWLVWSVVALLIAPWLIAFTTVPDLLSIYKAQPGNLLLIALFGVIWGIGAIMFGKGIDLLGISLSLPIMLGLINAVGTIMPMAINNPEELLSPTGLKIILGVLIILIGIAIVSIAGNKKATNENSGSPAAKKTFVIGLIVCLLAGVFGPMINFAFVFGKPIQNEAVQMGASLLNSANPVWSITLTGGFIANAIYCIYLLRKNNTYNNYQGKVNYMIFPIFAGVIWYLSIMFYGMGSISLGELGSSVGWATMQTLSILFGNIAGILAGEWKGASRKVFAILFSGVFCLMIGLIVIAI